MDGQRMNAAYSTRKEKTPKEEFTKALNDLERRVEILSRLVSDEDCAKDSTLILLEHCQTEENGNPTHHSGVNHTDFNKRIGSLLLLSALAQTAIQLIQCVKTLHTPPTYDNTPSLDELTTLANTLLKYVSICSHAEYWNDSLLKETKFKDIAAFPSRYLLNAVAKFSQIPEYFLDAKDDSTFKNDKTAQKLRIRIFNLLQLTRQQLEPLQNTKRMIPSVFKKFATPYIHHEKAESTYSYLQDGKSFLTIVMNENWIISTNSSHEDLRGNRTSSHASFHNLTTRQDHPLWILQHMNNYVFEPVISECKEEEKEDTPKKGATFSSLLDENSSSRRPFSKRQVQSLMVPLLPCIFVFDVLWNLLKRLVKVLRISKDFVMSFTPKRKKLSVEKSPAGPTSCNNLRMLSEQERAAAADQNSRTSQHSTKLGESPNRAPSTV